MNFYLGMFKRRPKEDNIGWAEVDKFSHQLSNILKNFEVLQQLDTSDVLPTTQSALLSNVFREDKASESLSKTDVLLNAPRQKEDCFEVQAILE